jgi:hypothetical protein
MNAQIVAPVKIWQTQLAGYFVALWKFDGAQLAGDSSSPARSS